MTSFRAVLLCVLALAIGGPRAIEAKPLYYWEFAEWREHDEGSGMKLVTEPADDRTGGYVLETWDLLGGNMTGVPAMMTVVAYNEGNTFWAKAISPIHGGAFGNTVGGEAFILVRKHYRKNSGVASLAFTYSSAFLEVMDYGSGRPPWFSPEAAIFMEVEAFDARSYRDGFVWGIEQSAILRTDLGIDINETADDIFVLDLAGRTRGVDRAVTEVGSHWKWDCDACLNGAYGFSKAILRAPYREAIDISAIPVGGTFAVEFTLRVRAFDRGQGETSAKAFAKDPVSSDDLSAAGVAFETSDLTEVDVPRCDEPGLTGVACLLDTGILPESCTADQAPAKFAKAIARARTLVDEASRETRLKQLRRLVTKVGAKIDGADRVLAKREAAKRGVKPSPACAADIHGVLAYARARLADAVCDSAAGVLAFDAPAYDVSEAETGGVTMLVKRTDGSTGALTATIATRGGTATSDLDYTPPAATVTFGDGDVGPHAVTVAVVDDHAGEPDESVTLTLSAPGACATGNAASTVLTIRDDDRADPEPTYTVGGAVTGLAGSGLVLQETRTGAVVTPGNGPFVFGYAFTTGTSYDVRITAQPTDPIQTCALANGSGTIATADVTAIAVTCVTPSAMSGLDASFGSGGLVTGSLTDGARGLALQADGKLLVLGQDALMRYDDDGGIDTTFGTAGTVPILFAGGLTVEAQDVVVQPDGLIVVAGATGALFGSRTDFAMSRFAADGSHDRSFGMDGTVVTDWDGLTDRAHRVLLQNDGRIVLVGFAGMQGGTGADFAVARYTTDGTLDASFGAGGKVTTTVAGLTDLAYAAALQPDGKLVVVGRAGVDGAADPDVGIVRYQSDGTLDQGFGDRGIVVIDLTGVWDEASDVAIQNDGEILVAVQAQIGIAFDFALARFAADGTLDASFGTHGLASTDFGSGHDYARALALQADGRIVVAGQSASATVSDFGVARYRPDGALDTSFGNAGTLTIDFFGSEDGAECIVTRSDGKLVVAGLARNQSSTGLGLARVIP